MKNVLANLALAITLLTGATALAQHDVRYVKKNDVNWIYPSYQSNVFRIEALNDIAKAKCDDINNNIEEAKSNGLEFCKKPGEQAKCNEPALAKDFRTYAFGQAFSESKNPELIEEKATTYWVITKEGFEQLKPSLLDEYAAQLGIDPKRSAVAKIQFQSIKLAKAQGKPPVIFREPTSPSEANYSYSWLLQNRLELVDDLGIYIRQVDNDPYQPIIGLTSYVLNCELNRGSGDYLEFLADVNAIGMRYYDYETLDQAYKAFVKMRNSNIPQGASGTDRAIMYGYYLARSFDKGLVDKIGLENLATSLFEVRNGLVRPVDALNLDEFEKKLSIVGVDENKGVAVRISK